MAEGGSARHRAAELRAEAAAARARAEALEREAGAWQAGADGEQRVGAELQNLPSQWRVLHDRLLRPGVSQVNLDHLVVGPTGVYLIDTKNWAGGVSVYDGTLWQHNGGSHCRRDALEQVHRFAAEVERTLGVPSTPVLVLAGNSSKTFSPQRVDGVEVLPTRQLRNWLSRQGGGEFIGDVDELLRRIESTYPPALHTDEDSTKTRGPVHRHTGVKATAPPITPSAPRSRPKRRAAGSAGKVLGQIATLLIGAAFLTQFVVPRLVDGAAKRSVRAPSTASAHPFCEALSAALMRKPLVEGLRKAVPGVHGQETCRWRLQIQGTPGNLVLAISFGSAARLEVDGIGQGRPQASANLGHAVARVPAGMSLPGWSKGAPSVNQPLALTMSYTLPNPANAVDLDRANAEAIRGLTALSEESARILAGASSTAPTS